MKYIPLTRNKQTIVDDEDYERFCMYKWQFKPRAETGYASRTVRLLNGERREVKLHRLIVDCPIGFEVDHINGDGLDNRRSNLRIVTKSQNMWNRKKQKGTSKHKGVYWNKANQKWHVQLQINKKKIWLGYYDTEELAIQAYRVGAKKHFGEYARFN